MTYVGEALDSGVELKLSHIEAQSNNNEILPSGREDYGRG
jgi:hypothetical protein